MKMLVGDLSADSAHSGRKINTQLAGTLVHSH